MLPVFSLLLHRFLRSACLGWLAVVCAQAQPTLPHLNNYLTIQKPGPEYGPELKSESLGLGPAMDVAIAGDFAYVIGERRLVILSGVRKGTLRPVGELLGLGHVRQIVVARDHAFISAREDGLFIVDVADPSQPKLANHYDTVELATGVAVSGDVLAVGNRFAGVELIDISTPADPRYLATVRVGEAQSVAFHGSWLYAGTWGGRAVAVIDVSDPRRPVHVRSIPLQGNGDGLDVRGNLLAAATGHHARSNETSAPGDTIWGHGHGVEFFDVSNPGEPRRISGLKFPPFYRIDMDTWGVVLAGGYAFVNDTYNGFFLVDVRDANRPRFAGHRQLPVVKVGGDPSPATGLAVSGGRAFVAGAHDDLHVVETGLAVSNSPLADFPLRVPPLSKVVEEPRLTYYEVDGSVHAVRVWRKDQLLVAAGSSGLHVVQLKGGRFERLKVYPTNGFARDVVAHGDAVYVAESLGGVSRWALQEDGSLRRVGGYEVPGQSIHQITLVDEGRIAFLAVGANTLHVVRFGPGDEVKRLLEHTPPSGLFYREPFPSVSSDARRLLVQWHTMGLFEYAVEDGTVKATGYHFAYPMSSDCGVAPWRDGWLVTSRGGFFWLRPGEMRAPKEIGRTRLEGKSLPGKPTVYDNTAFISDPLTGEVAAIDLAEANGPRLMAHLQLTGHPGRVRLYKGKVLIPAGRQGLILWDFAKTR